MLERMARLIITADDYGYAEEVDAGVIEAAEQGLIDSVAAIVDGPSFEPEPIAATGVEIGLHLVLDGGPDAPRASDRDRRRAEEAIARQLAAFEDALGRAPAHLSGHHHAHARPGLGVVVADRAEALGIPVRSIDARQRRLLSCRGVATPDYLVGRLDQSEPVDPGLERLDSGLGLVEWMVHPGHEAPELDSDYARGRLEDLDHLRGFEPPDGWERTSFGAAFER